MWLNKAHLIASEAVVEEEVSESVVEVGTKSDEAVSFVRVGELPGEMMVVMITMMVMTTVAWRARQPPPWLWQASWTAGSARCRPPSRAPSSTSCSPACAPGGKEVVYLVPNMVIVLTWTSIQVSSPWQWRRSSGSQPSCPQGWAGQGTCRI